MRVCDCNEDEVWVCLQASHPVQWLSHAAGEEEAAIPAIPQAAEQGGDPSKAACAGDHHVAGCHWGGWCAQPLFHDKIEQNLASQVKFGDLLMHARQCWSGKFCSRDMSAADTKRMPRLISNIMYNANLRTLIDHRHILCIDFGDVSPEPQLARLGYTASDRCVGVCIAYP